MMTMLRTLISSAGLCLPMLAAAQGNLENPVAGSTESGIGVVSGWHCTAKEITVFVDGASLGKSGVGSARNGTAGICGHANTGFSLLYNYNLPEPGAHGIAVYADGQLLERRTFNTVRSGGVPFLEGKSATATIQNFPVNGKATALRWSQAKQSFVVVGNTDTTTLDGTYALYRVTLQTSRYALMDTAANSGFSATGTMAVTGSSYTQQISILLNGVSMPVTIEGRLNDRGHYLYDQINGNQLVVVERGAALITSILYQDPTLGWVNEIDYWTKTN
ncbi:MAG: hypothetical protein J0H09_05650 [Burkholderiales bacterium]|nr:hypothetical protein [Burkholderiales bacterium]